MCRKAREVARRENEIKEMDARLVRETEQIREKEREIEERHVCLRLEFLKMCLWQSSSLGGGEEKFCCRSCDVGDGVC